MKFNRPTEDENTEIVEGNYDQIKDFELDPDGYFLIKVDKEDKKLVVGFCKENNKIIVKITGNKPSDIYHQTFKRGLIKSMHHAAYLGSELQKAYLALKYNLEYVQDSELDLEKK